MIPDLGSYDHILVFFSGGKDSLASILNLLDLGVPPEKIELWHHLVDGHQDEEAALMDWAITPGYCQAVAQALDLPLYFSWRVGGFKRELLKENDRIAPVKFEYPNGTTLFPLLGQSGGLTGKITTRRKFPAVSQDLQIRWCSPALKIQVAEIALRNQHRFLGRRTLIVSGERAQESPARARYKTFEPHRTNCLRRHVDHWRPVHHWSEEDVWVLIEQYGINPHPAYWLGFGRCSCLFCIFGNENQWSTAGTIDPDGISSIIHLEKEFDYSIHPSRRFLPERLAQGLAYDVPDRDKWIEVARGTEFNEPMFLGEGWSLPPGAYRKDGGPS
jgi:3'-phosphoadenosine 5'-phosphosulfate sulfotransferase (PAPS reductase)/FAD synthetase